MKTKLLLPAICLMLFSSGYAQEDCPTPTSYNTLDINNVSAGFLNSGGELIGPSLSAPGLEVPIGSGIHSIFGSAMWIGGRDEFDNLHLSVRQHMQDEYDWTFRPGPMNNAGPGNYITDCEGYDHIFKINRSDVVLHRLYFSMMTENGGIPPTDPPFEFGYEIPFNIMNWPAHAELIDGEPQSLAPFFDNDCCGGTPGVYEPELGDYPAFRFPDNEEIFDCEKHLLGDQVLWWVVNDAYGTEITFGIFPALGMEIHNMAYAYKADDQLDNAIFIRRTLINRSGIDYHDVYLGEWTDADLGNANDDYYGTDVDRGMSYFYNGDNFDETGYGDSPPAIGIDFVGGPLADENDGLDNNFNGEIDEADERLRMEHSITWNNTTNPVNGNPSFPDNYYAYLTGHWINGELLTHGGDGYNPDDPDAIPAKMIYPGDSDPLLLNTNGNEVESWTETTALNPPGDRRNLMSSGPFTFADGDIKVFTKVIVWAREENCAPFPCSVDLVAEADDVAQDTHDNCYVLPCMVLDAQFDTELDGSEAFFSSNITSGEEYHWTFGDGTELTTTTPFASHQYESGGEMNVCLTIVYSCGTSSNCQSIEVVPTAIDEQTQLQINLFPNPANEQLQISLPDLQNTLLLQVYNLQGQQLMEQQLNSTTSTLSTSALKNGLYLLKISDNNGNIQFHRQFTVVR